MGMTERLNEDLKAAMKAREEGKLRLSVIRMAKAAIKNQEIQKSQPLTEEEILQIISKELKMRRDILPEYEKAGRSESVETIQAEMEILLEYLPKQLTEEEILALIRNAVRETGAQGPADMGKVMGKLSPLTKGQADGKVVSALVKQELSGREAAD
ncbi:MAG: GatB/YqeY domain-containing protein [Peptococcaceae bacterium]|jgi:uncharacterized protein YqeY|nr:GatB/YqeY domain-containing protein [Peptococcaceae bacterium]